MTLFRLLMRKHNVILAEQLEITWIVWKANWTPNTSLSNKSWTVTEGFCNINFFNGQFRQAADKCFSHTIAEANRDDRCVLAASDLESKAWDRNGPLRDCSICRTFAAGAIKVCLASAYFYCILGCSQHSSWGPKMHSHSDQQSNCQRSWILHAQKNPWFPRIARFARFGRRFLFGKRRCYQLNLRLHSHSLTFELLRWTQARKSDFHSSMFEQSVPRLFGQTLPM